jgi:glutamate racemase
LLRDLIEREAALLAGHPVRVVDSAHATALAVEQFLTERDGAASPGRRGKLELLVTDLPASFSLMAGRFLGEPISDVEQIDL